MVAMALTEAKKNTASTHMIQQVLLRKKANISDLRFSDLGSSAGGYLSSLQVKMTLVLVVPGR